jgi:molybdate transport system ATP-binding protein
MSLRLEQIVLPLAEYTLEFDAEFSAPITGLFGPSGAGKTTLLEIIAGLRRPKSGSVWLNARPLTDAGKRIQIAPEHRRVGYVPQDLALFPHLSAGENLHYGLRRDGRAQLPSRRVVEVLELAPLLTRPISQLSGGEQQRVALGRALLAEPEVLLLDEPLSNLDDRLKERILDCIRDVQSEFRVPVVYVTHSQWELARICETVVHLAKGKRVGAE